MNIIEETPVERLAVRISEKNPNHHLWLNHGTWWTHYTIHKPDYTKQRVRVSLETRDLEEARRKRDLLLSTGGDSTIRYRNVTWPAVGRAYDR